MQNNYCLQIDNVRLSVITEFMFALNNSEC